MTAELMCLMAVVGLNTFLLVGNTLLQLWQNKVLTSTLIETARSLISASNVAHNPQAGLIYEQAQGRLALERQKQQAQDILRTKQRLNAEAVKQAMQDPPRTLLLHPKDRPVYSVPRSPGPLSALTKLSPQGETTEKSET